MTPSDDRTGDFCAFRAGDNVQVKDPVIRDLENCVKCGSCKALCPTYARDRAEPLSARGRLILLRELERGNLAASPLLYERIWSCLLCGMCETTCPVGIEVTEAVYQGRGELPPPDRRGRIVRRLARFVLRRPRLSYGAARRLNALIPYLYRKGVIPFDLALPSEPLRKGLKIYKPPRPKGRVAVFAGCSINFLFPEVGESLIHLLVGAGYEVVLPAGEVCCGAPLRAMGLESDAEALARRNLEVFGKLKAEAVLSLCPTCTLALRRHYPALVERGVPNAMDATEFLARKADGLFAEYRRRDRGPVAWHDPCHLRFGLGISSEPRELLRRMGHEVVEPEAHNCCGLGVALTFDKLAEAFLEDREREFREAGTLVTACPGCMLQLGRRHGNVVHIVQALEEALYTDEE